MTRQSIDATHDSRDTGERFHVTTQVGDRTISFQRRIPDPFVRVTVRVGIWHVLCAFLRFQPAIVTVIVGADPDVMDDVLELDYNTLTPSSTRRQEWDAHVRGVLTMMARNDASEECP